MDALTFNIGETLTVSHLSPTSPPPLPPGISLAVKQKIPTMVRVSVSSPSIPHTPVQRISVQWMGRGHWSVPDWFDGQLAATIRCDVIGKLTSSIGQCSWKDLLPPTPSQAQTWLHNWRSIDELCSLNPVIAIDEICSPFPSSASLTMGLITYLTVHLRARKPWPWIWWHTCLSIDELCINYSDVEDVPVCLMTSSADLTLMLMQFLSVQWLAPCSPHPEVDDLPGCPLTSSAALTLRLLT